MPVAALWPWPLVALFLFPGQYALPPQGNKFPVWPKACLRHFSTPGERAACLESVANDWSDLARYATANADLAPPAKGEQRVVFFGDSITDNWSRDGYGGFFPGKPYINRGIGGQTATQMVGRFRQDVIALQPGTVIILAGTNDLAGNAGPETLAMIQHALTNMAELARANGIHAILASLLPVCDCVRSSKGEAYVQTQDRPAAKIVALNTWIAEYAKKNKLIYLDYFPALAGQDGAMKVEFTGDGLHPNAAGYAVMAPLAEKAIAAALRTR